MTFKKEPSYQRLVSLTVYCLVISVLLSFVSTQTNNSRGYKQLNTVISVAIRDGRNAGDFKTIEPPHNILAPTISKCVRELNDVNVMDPLSFQGALARVYKTGVLRIGVTTINDPSVFSINSTTGAPQGYNADVGWLVTNHMGLILGKKIYPSFVVYNFTSYFNDTLKLLKNSGTVDTVVDVSFLSSRVHSTDFSCAYSDSNSYAAFRDAYTALPAGVPTPSKINDLNRPEIRVAVVPGTAYDAAVDRYLPLAQKVLFSDDNSVFDAVGTAADITFYLLDNVVRYNKVHNNRLAMFEGTQVHFAGGLSFITVKWNTST